MLFDPAQLLLFLGASLTLVAIPGPAVSFIVARTLERGTRAGLRTVAGIAIGNLCQALAAASGLAAALVSYPAAYRAIKYAGALYLVYLGLRAFLGAGRAADATLNRPDARAHLRQGVLVGLLNPKVALFLVAFLPQFSDPDRGPLWAQFLVLGLIFVAIGWAGDSAWALLSGTVGRRIRGKGPGRWKSYLAGGVFFALGLITLVF